MSNFVDLQGGAVKRLKAERRAFGGPTLKDAAAVRRARDMLMLDAQHRFGFNGHDLKLIFGLSTPQIRNRIRTLKQAAPTIQAILSREGQ